MEPTTGESMKTFSKTSGANPRNVSREKVRDLASGSLWDRYNNRLYDTSEDLVLAGVSEQEQIELCDRGYFSVCNILGRLEFARGNHAKSDSLYRKSCDGGNRTGCHLLWISAKYRNDHDEIEYARRKFDEISDFYKETCDKREEEENVYRGVDINRCINRMFVREKRGDYKEVESLYRKVCVERPTNRFECIILVTVIVGQEDSRSCSGGNLKSIAKCTHFNNMKEMRDEVRGGSDVF